MKNLILTKIDPIGIVDFLNKSDLDIEVMSKGNDYWVDVFTDARILNSKDKILFRNVNEEDEIFLRIKFGEDIQVCDIVQFDK